MDTRELNKLIRIGEGYTIEFKASPSHIAREICAFANASGGRILVGIGDQGRKIGVNEILRDVLHFITFVILPRRNVEKRDTKAGGS
jgi:predicted HTH transcriptional regulator